LQPLFSLCCLRYPPFSKAGLWFFKFNTAPLSPQFINTTLSIHYKSQSCMEATEKASLETDEQPAMSRGRSVKNLLAVGLSFVLMFTSYQGLSAIQSSFNSSGGLGVAGLAVTYASVVASSLALAPLVIGRLGPKRTMAACLCAYLLYLAANLYPHWGTIIPASVLLGVSSAPLWAAMSVYVVRLAGEYARAGGHDGGGDGTEGRQRSAVSVFFGVFFTMFASSNIWGNLISYLALSDWQQHPASALGSAVSNLSCGHRFCSAGNADGDGGGVERPPEYKFYIMMGCFMGSGLLSVLVLLLLVDRTDSEAERRRVTLAQLRGNILAMLRHMADWRQLLLLCLTVNVGLSQSFIVSDFTEGFVACSSGIGAVGRVMMCYGAGHVLGVLFGLVAGRLGKLPVLLAAGCCQIGLEVAGLLWQVEAEPVAYFYCYAFAWGCVDTVWNSQMNAIYGEYFSDRTDAAFSAYRFFESLGYILGFSYNKLLCINQKLGVMLAAVSAGCLMLVASAAVDRRARRMRVGGQL
ncbi:hypothetical protein BOX15_Mlig024443g2, partial [Macrostomum lignano]